MCGCVTFNGSPTCSLAGWCAGRAGLPEMACPRPSPTTRSMLGSTSAETWRLNRGPGPTGFQDVCGRSVLGKRCGKNARLQQLGWGRSPDPLARPGRCLPREAQTDEAAGRGRNPWGRVVWLRLVSGLPFPAAEICFGLEERGRLGPGPRLCSVRGLQRARP